MAETPRSIRRSLVALLAPGLLLAGCTGGGGDAPGGRSDAAAEPERGPRSQPGTGMGIYTPEQHRLYDGRFILTGSRVYQAGTLADASPWDHMGDDASNVRPVDGTIEVGVNEIENSGTFKATLELPEGRYVVELDEWVDGWGTGRAALDGEPLYDGYQIHFMVTQGMRDRETLRVASRTADATSEAGAVNPAAMPLDFYIRSPEPNEANHPGREVLDHFFAMEVTWR